MKKRLHKILNIILSLIIVLTLSGCAGVDAQLTSCLEEFSSMLGEVEEKPSPEQGGENEEPTTMELVFPEGRFLSTADTATYKDCYVLVDGKWASQSYDVEWRFDGTPSSHKGNMYTFAPSTTEKSVTVEAVITYTTVTEETDENGDFIEEETEYVAKETFVYYTPFVAPIATCENTNGYNTYSVSGLSTNAVVEWFVNGEKKTEGVQFVFMPIKAGRYNVSAMVNGTVITVENSSVIRSGPQTVSNITVDIDSYFPQVYITFDADSNAQYTIRKTASSNENDYKDYTATTNSILIPYSDFFDGKNSYTVKIKTINDDVYLGSLFSSAVTVSSPSSTVYNYLNKSYGYENAYISDENDFYEQFDYMMLSRTQPTSGETRLDREFYFAYDIDGGISTLVNNAFDACGYTGSYRLSTSGRNPYTITVHFKTGNVPVVPASSNVPASSQYAINMNAYPLAISSTGRTEALPIDQKPQIQVSYTDQVYRLAELGYCPIPTKGSVAETVMNNARNVVSLITDESMTDYEIALAVYDWVMYKNSYNNSVLRLATESAVQHPAFYLEGILYADNYGYAVCDGISKTYSLLCNIAGVKCIRVVGDAGQNGKWSGHAWNKVNVEGEWYIVDATWGDVSMGISYRTSGMFGSTYTDYYEMGMHNYFLVTDDFVSGNHREDSELYPKTAPLPYNHFANKKMYSGGTVVDMYVNETGTELKNKLDLIADAIIADVRSKNRIQSVQVGEQLKQSYYFFYELGYSSLAKSNLISYMQSSSSFAKKLKNQNYGFSLFEVDGAVGIIVSYHYSSRLPSSSLTIN